MEEGAVLNNRYQLLERIGRGGMSDVFRARDLMLERSVAIKVLHEKYSDDKAFQDRFTAEARAAAVVGCLEEPLQLLLRNASQSLIWSKVRLLRCRIPMTDRAMRLSSL